MFKFEDYNWEYTDSCLLESYKRYFQRIKKEERTLKTYTYNQCYLLPLKSVLNGQMFYTGGVLDSNKNYIEKAKVYPNRIFQGYDFNLENVEYNDSEVIFAGCFWKHWGHFILEQVSRLWYFLQEKDPKLPIVYISTFPLSGNYLEFFELLGIDISRLIWVDKITRFKKIHIPEVSMVAMNYYTEEYNKIFEKIRNNVPKDNNYPKKIFFSRRAFSKSKDTDFGHINEIESLFELNGYEIISPEMLSLKEQVKLLQSCDEYACVSGTLPHNLLFANKKVKSVILNKSYVVNPHQSLIEMVVGIKSTYIDVHLSLLPQHIGWGPFFFYFSENLKSWAKDNGFIFNKENSSMVFLKLFGCYLYQYVLKMAVINKRFGFQNINTDIKNFYLCKIKNQIITNILLVIITFIPRNLFCQQVLTFPKTKFLNLLRLILKYKFER